MPAPARMRLFAVALFAAILYPSAKPMETFTASAGSERPPAVKF